MRIYIRVCELKYETDCPCLSLNTVMVFVVGSVSVCDVLWGDSVVFRPGTERLLLGTPPGSTALWVSQW